MKFANILFFPGIIVFVTACSSGGVQAVDDPHIFNPADTTIPVVDIYTPSENEVFSTGDTIRISGKVTDNSLYRGNIRITNDANGAVVKEQLFEIHGFQVYNFYLEHKTIVLAVTNYTVTVQYQDHGFNTGTNAVKVRVNP